MSRFVFALVLAGLLAACGPGYIKGTRIEATPEKQAIAELVERYRIAVEQRDPEALRALASGGYYENGSTTEDPNDDYDALGLERVLADVKSNIKSVRYDLEITAMEVFEDVATVDFDYRSQFLFTMGEQDHWKTASDRNRLTLRKERGAWKIVSGM